MVSLTNEDTQTLITEYCSISSEKSAITVKQTSLDGKVHLQRIGGLTTVYNVTVYVTKSGKVLLENALDLCSLLKVNTRSNVYYGRLSAISKFEKITSEYFKAVLTLEEDTP